MKESEIVRSSYDNLLSRWELNSIDELYNASSILLSGINNNMEEFNNMSQEEFDRIYEEKIKNSPQNEKINVFLCDMKKILKNI